MSPINFLYQPAEGRKTLKYSVAQTFMTSQQSDLISHASARPIGSESNLAFPILFVMIKNITTKKKLEQVQSEY